MAATSGTEDSGVVAAAQPAPPSPFAEIEEMLREHPGRFDFFQAVRLLLRMYAGREPVGHFVNPNREAVRFAVRQSLSFPPNTIDEIQWDGKILCMRVAFMGLTGPAGVLPQSYSELIVSRARARDHTLADFLDIFNHRMISLFYRAWEKYRFGTIYERDGIDRVSQYLMALIGLGTPGLQNRLAVPDETLLFYTGLLSLQTRSATALKHILESYFEVPVEVEEFVGVWRELDDDNLCVFEDADSYSHQLGVGTVVGDAIWDQQSRIRLRLGPLTEQQYLSFLPTGTAYVPLRELTRFFCGPDLEVEAQLILKQPEVPRCDLGKDGESGPRLGWFTWIKSGLDFDRSPADTVLLLA
jgi:type VI secretion system protein ImpH